MKKATINYASGWKLTFNKYNNHPLLFMEWMATKLREQKQQYKYKIEDDSDNECFIIRFDFIGRSDMQDCKDYINENS